LLSNYRRSFNKKSVRNWGTPATPAPTLGLEPAANVSCSGTAFEFLDMQRNPVENLLRDREGNSFALIENPVCLPDGREVRALTPVNDRNASTYKGAIPVLTCHAMCSVAGHGLNSIYTIGMILLD
jgi:cation transport regulator ChaC